MYVYVCYINLVYLTMPVSLVAQARAPNSIMHNLCLFYLQISQDFLISRVFHKVICGIPVKCLDATIIPLLRCVHHHDDLSALLGNTIISMTTF